MSCRSRSPPRRAACLAPPPPAAARTSPPSPPPSPAARAAAPPLPRSARPAWPRPQPPKSSPRAAADGRSAPPIAAAARTASARRARAWRPRSATNGAHDQPSRCKVRIGGPRPLALGPVGVAHPREHRRRNPQQRRRRIALLCRRLRSPDRAAHPRHRRHREPRRMDEGEQFQQIEPADLAGPEPLPDQRRIQDDMRRLRQPPDRLARATPRAPRRPPRSRFRHGLHGAREGAKERPRPMLCRYENERATVERRRSSARPRSAPRPGPMKKRASCSSAIRTASPMATPSCSRPATVPRACPTSAPSSKCCARPWSATPMSELTGGAPTRLIAFSDDMDGMRKVPDNVPNQAMLTEYLGKPLTQVPDPFGTHESFAHHNNAMLRHFLDRFGFDYEFYSSTDCYAGGRFDDSDPAGAAPLGRRHGRDAADPARGTAPDLFAGPAAIPDDRPRAAGAGRGRRRRSGHHRLHRRGWIAGRAIRAWRPRQAAMEGRLGDALGRARGRL